LVRAAFREITPFRVVRAWHCQKRQGSAHEISSGAVGATVLRARAGELDWPEVEALGDDVLEGWL
jgi:hypothetical protein